MVTQMEAVGLRRICTTPFVLVRAVRDAILSNIFLHHRVGRPQMGQELGGKNNSALRMVGLTSIGLDGHNNISSDLYRVRLCESPANRKKPAREFQRAEDSILSYRENERAAQLMRQGIALEKKGAIDEAIAVYERVIREHPKAAYEDEIGEGIYSKDARDRLNVLYCLRLRKSDFLAESRHQLVKLVREAFQSKRAEDLTRYASCDFTVGKPESDAVWQLVPDRVMPTIIGLGQMLDWSSLSFDLSGHAVLRALTNKEEHIFSLTQISGRWKWDGYYTTDSQILDRLWKIKRQNKHNSNAP